MLRADGEEQPCPRPEGAPAQTGGGPAPGDRLRVAGPEAGPTEAEGPEGDGSRIVPSALAMQHWRPGSYSSLNAKEDSNQDGEGTGIEPGAWTVIWR